MFKYANQILDFIDEKVKRDIDLPFEYESPKNDSDYALILKTASGDYLKKYPLNNQNNVIYSFVSYEENKDKLTDTMQKIAEHYLAKRLNLYNITHSFKVAEDIKGNLYNIQPKDETVHYREPEPTLFAYGEKLPIDTIDNLMKSANEFIKQAHSLEIEERKKVANAMVMRADELRVNLSTEIKKYASYKPGTLTQIKNAMATRLTNYPLSAKTKIYDAISTVKTAEDVLELAKVVDKVDELLKIKKTNHPDVASSFFSIEKDADDINTEKLNRALEAGLLTDYLDTPTIGALKDVGENAYKELNPESKNIITSILKNIN